MNHLLNVNLLTIVVTIDREVKYTRVRKTNNFDNLICRFAGYLL